jgi:uracil-DNA glycosylase family 4
VPPDSLARLRDEIHACRRCPRLVAWREAVAADPPRRYRGQSYWARPVAGFGDPQARILLVGLAPAAHGGNRTGRVFTGDRSGDWLYAALHRARLANQPVATGPGDGLRLTGAYISAAVRCAPPLNQPAPAERDACLPFLGRELALLAAVRVIVPLGKFAWDATWRALTAGGRARPGPRPAFAHGAEFDAGPYRLAGCFHPSQQNTFTGRLTETMIDAVLERAKNLASR